MAQEVATKTDVKKMNPHQLVVHRMPEIAAALPSHIPSDKFRRVFEMAVMKTPELLKCEPRSVLEAVQKAAADGLVVDGREAALVIYGNKAQYMPMVGGLLKRARNSGEIASIHATVVYQAEIEAGKFRLEQGTEPKIFHEPLLTGERGPVVLVYSVCRLKDGSISIDWMRVDEINAIRARSRSGGKGPWSTDWNEMAKKTVLRRHSKVLPMDSDVARAFQRVDDLYEFDRPAPLPHQTKEPGGAARRLQPAAIEEEPEIEDAEHRDLDGEEDLPI